MNKTLKRRDALKVAAAVGGLFALEKIASAAPVRKQTTGLAGNWLYQGQPCAIWQQGVVLIFVNEGGGLATGRMTGPDTFILQAGFGWDNSLIGIVSNGGNLITWSNDTQWQRA
jgi:hypothetical protein